MKVILKRDVVNLGSIGDQVKVAPGYARNFLIPKGMAITATPGNIRQFEAEKDAYLKKARKRREDAEALKEKVEGLVLEFTRRASEEDKLFGSVTTNDVADALKDKHGVEIATKDVILEHPIKALGEHTVTVRLHPEVTSDVKINVVRE